MEKVLKDRGGRESEGLMVRIPESAEGYPGKIGERIFSKDGPPQVHFLSIFSQSGGKKTKEKSTYFLNSSQG